MFSYLCCDFFYAFLFYNFHIFDIRRFECEYGENVLDFLKLVMKKKLISNGAGGDEHKISFANISNSVILSLYS
jgi:hypothetical protein